MSGYVASNGKAVFVNTGIIMASSPNVETISLGVCATTAGAIGLTSVTVPTGYGPYIHLRFVLDGTHTNVASFPASIADTTIALNTES